MEKSYTIGQRGEKERSRLQCQVSSAIFKEGKGSNGAQISEHKAGHKTEQILVSSAATLNYPVTRPGEFELTDLCS